MRVNDDGSCFYEKWESDSELVAKVYGEVDIAEETYVNKRSIRRKPRLDAWTRKRKHKKKMVRKFLSINPDIDLSKQEGITIRRWIGFYSERNQYGENYSINPYTRVYLSHRGDIRRFYGKAICWNSFFQLDPKPKSEYRKANRRLRRLQDIEVNNYSFYKKLLCYNEK